MRHPCSSQHRPGGSESSGSPVRAGPAGLCGALTAAVLPSSPPVYSSAAPGDFLPLCPRTLPFPALREEMSGKYLKSSSERFPLAIAVLLVPGSDLPRCQANGDPPREPAGSALTHPCSPRWGWRRVFLPLSRFCSRSGTSVPAASGLLSAPQLCTHHMFPEASLIPFIPLPGAALHGCWYFGGPRLG